MKYFERVWGNNGHATGWQEVSKQQALEVLQRQFVKPELALDYLEDAGSMTIGGTELAIESDLSQLRQA